MEVDTGEGTGISPEHKTKRLKIEDVEFSEARPESVSACSPHEEAMQETACVIFELAKELKMRMEPLPNLTGAQIDLENLSKQIIVSESASVMVDNTTVAHNDSLNATESSLEFVGSLFKMSKVNYQKSRSLYTDQFDLN